MTYRVIQWASGKVGSRAMRAVLEHPDLELTGLFAYSADKIGKDIGEICGLAPIGIKATGDRQAILDMQADCVLYMPDQRFCNFDDVCAILRSGKNIVTTLNQFFYPKALDPEIYARIEAAAQAGRTSIFATGSSPGFITEALPLVLTSMTRRLDMLAIDEYADLSHSDLSPEMLFGVMGYGKGPEMFHADSPLVQFAGVGFCQSLRLLADHWGRPLQRIEGSAECAVAKRDIEIADGVIRAGTVAALRLAWTGYDGDKPLLRFRVNWYCTQDIDRDWGLRGSGWRVELLGDAPMTVEIALPVSEESAEVAATYTANLPVNAVPFVCEATPGIKTIVDLPPITARFA